MYINEIFEEIFNDTKVKKESSILREIKYEHQGKLNRKIDIDFENKISELGFSIDIPNDWGELKLKNEVYFDKVEAEDFNTKEIFNIKIQVSLTQITHNMLGYLSLDRVAKNMGYIESVDFNNGHCEGKLICGEGIDGTCNYIFIVKGSRGIYYLRVVVDKYLESMYEDIIDHIIYSFDIDNKI